MCVSAEVSQHSFGSAERWFAASGMLRIFGTWQATENGSLTFKVEHRHAFGDLAPQDLGFDAGALSIPGTAFNDGGALLTNLFWTQRATNGAWTFQAGQIDTTDFVDIYGLVSPFTDVRIRCLPQGKVVKPKPKTAFGQIILPTKIPGQYVPRELRPELRVRQSVAWCEVRCGGGGPGQTVCKRGAAQLSQRKQTN